MKKEYRCERENLTFKDKYLMATWEKVYCNKSGYRIKLYLPCYFFLMFCVSIASIYTVNLDVGFLLKIVLAFSYYLGAVYICPVKVVKSENIKSKLKGYD
jgi:hypothetical protein